MCQELREAARILSSLQFRSLGARKVTLWLLVLKDVLLHQVNVISITREHIYVFLLELAAALVWNRTSLILLLLSSFLLVYSPGLSHTKVKRHLLCAHNVHPLPTQLIYPTKPSIAIFSVLKIRWQSSNTYYEKLMSHLANST